MIVSVNFKRKKNHTKILFLHKIFKQNIPLEHKRWKLIDRFFTHRGGHRIFDISPNAKMCTVKKHIRHHIVYRIQKQSPIIRGQQCVLDLNDHICTYLLTYWLTESNNNVTLYLIHIYWYLFSKTFVKWTHIQPYDLKCENFCFITEPLHYKSVFPSKISLNPPS